MAHRAMLTERQRATLFELATEPEALEQHYILDDSDLAHIAERRREENKSPPLFVLLSLSSSP